MMMMARCEAIRREFHCPLHAENVSVSPRRSVENSDVAGLAVGVTGIQSAFVRLLFKQKLASHSAGLSAIKVASASHGE